MRAPPITYSQGKELGKLTPPLAPPRTRGGEFALAFRLRNPHFLLQPYSLPCTRGRVGDEVFTGYFDIPTPKSPSIPNPFPVRLSVATQAGERGVKAMKKLRLTSLRNFRAAHLPLTARATDRSLCQSRRQPVLEFVHACRANLMPHCR